MSIFREMHPTITVNPGHDYLELKRMLSEAIERGYVESVPVMIKRNFANPETWYREIETGIIFALTHPEEERVSGTWMEIEPQELIEGQPLQ
jgi:hypothetical protein